jgi:hypothetical protein
MKYLSLLIFLDFIVNFFLFPIKILTDNIFFEIIDLILLVFEILFYTFFYILIKILTYYLFFKIEDLNFY